jgi:HAMP domain-containing protein
VRLPIRSFWQVAASVVGPVQIALLAAAFVIAVLFIQFAVVRPIRSLTVAAERISVGEAADLGAARINRKSRNEVHQLILATERLRASMTLAIQRLAKRQQQPQQPPPPGGGQGKGGE